MARVAIAELPETGTDPRWLIVLASVLVGAGLVFVELARRRRVLG